MICCPAGDKTAGMVNYHWLQEILFRSSKSQAEVHEMGTHITPSTFPATCQDRAASSRLCSSHIGTVWVMVFSLTRDQCDLTASHFDRLIHIDLIGFYAEQNWRTTFILAMGEDCLGKVRSGWSRLSHFVTRPSQHAAILLEAHWFQNQRLRLRDAAAKFSQLDCKILQGPGVTSNVKLGPGARMSFWDTSVSVIAWWAGVTPLRLWPWPAPTREFWTKGVTSNRVTLVSCDAGSAPIRWLVGHCLNWCNQHSVPSQWWFIKYFVRFTTDWLDRCHYFHTSSCSIYWSHVLMNVLIGYRSLLKHKVQQPSTGLLTTSHDLRITSLQQLIRPPRDIRWKTSSLGRWVLTRQSPQSPGSTRFKSSPFAAEFLGQSNSFCHICFW